MKIQYIFNNNIWKLFSIKYILYNFSRTKLMEIKVIWLNDIISKSAYCLVFVLHIFIFPDLVISWFSNSSHIIYIWSQNINYHFTPSLSSWKCCCFWVIGDTPGKVKELILNRCNWFSWKKYEFSYLGWFYLKWNNFTFFQLQNMRKSIDWSKFNYSNWPKNFSLFLKK